MSNQLWVVATPLIVWMGVFCYVVIVDRRIRALAEQLRSEDE